MAIHITLLFLLITCGVKAQHRKLFFEAGGSGGLGSVNYENKIKVTEKAVFNWRVGLTTTPIDPNAGYAIAIPLLVNYVRGATRHKWEVGLGQGPSITTRGFGYVRGLVNAGYRNQHIDKRVFYRITYTPLISYINTLQWEHWAGVSIGFKLKEKE